MIASRSFAIRPFLLSLLVVSALSSKALHLYQHANSIPLFLFAIYFPTFFILETLLFVSAWFLLNRVYGKKSAIATAFVGLLSLITLAAASSQIGFFFVTGAEVRWNAAKSVGNDPEGRKLMLSGLKPVLCSAVFLLVLSTLLAAPISFLMNKWLLSIFSVADESSQQLPGAYLKGTLRNKGRRWSVFVAAGVFVLWLVRPSEPYNHISNAIPFALLSAVLPSHADAEVETIPFPLPNLLTEEYWEPAHGHYKGWAPKMGESDGYAENVPKWASDELPDGFDRWIKAWQDKHWSQGTSTNISDEAEDEEGGEGDVDESEDVQTYYNPVVDPLRINNLDGGILDPLQKALKERDIPITHVVLVLMESARKDIFPFKSGSFLHDKILGSYEHKKPDNFDDLDAKLSRMTPVAEMLTGESTGFGDHELPEDLWRDPSDPDMGGINVNGMLTGSTLSFKSALVNYCGVGPLPVDFMMEAEAAIYQPCIMQVLNLFNQLKEKTGTSPSHDNSTRATLEDIRKRKWTSTFTQSITELYDKQNILNRHMGFDNSICREQISNSRAKHHHPGMTEINYFGYPEVEVYPYIKDVIEETVKSNKRLFLSHFTSTTHHPWNTPSGFHDETYFEDDILGSHDDMDKYLNTVRYVDQWLGKFMGLLDETGIANETLVVFVGDHGQAFHEDSPVSGTYENGHISNFRIPVVFRHPLLPRIQITANSSTVAVVPTILDLLVNTKSLDEKDSDVAQDLMNEYEGQSLIRPFKPEHNGRQAWNFGIINAGGTMLSVTSAASPYRMVMPLTKDFEYTFSNLETDPNEVKTINEWKLNGLVRRVGNEYGNEAAEWVEEADEIAKWWIEERKRLWNYHESS